LATDAAALRPAATNAGIGGQCGARLITGKIDKVPRR
jgi:hypothetical protein